MLFPWNTRIVWFFLLLLSLCLLPNAHANDASASASASASAASFELSRSASMKLLESGKILDSNGDFTSATSLYEQSILMDGSNELASNALYIKAHALMNAGKIIEAMQKLLFITKNTSHYTLEVMYLLGLGNMSLGNVEEAAKYFKITLFYDPLHSSARINLASLHHTHGNKEVAIREYSAGLYYLGAYRYTIRSKHGFPQETGGNAYMLDREIMLRLNIAAAYIQLGYYIIARKQLSCLLSDLRQVENLVCTTATAVSTSQSKHNSRGSWGVGGCVDGDNDSHSLHTIDNSDSTGNANHHNRHIPVPVLNIPLHMLHSDCISIRNDIGTTISHILNIQRATCDWQDREILETYVLQSSLSSSKTVSAPSIHNIINDTSANKNANEKTVAHLLPFDALLVPYVTLQQMRNLAINYVLYKKLPRQGQGQGQDFDNLTVKSDKILRLGFISYDFNNHPTAHLVEALFAVISEQQQLLHAQTQTQTQELNITSVTTANVDRAIYERVQTFIYSYGKDDSSIYRKRLIQLAGKFVDIVGSESYLETSSIIHQDGIDILLDMQVHTLGNKLEILSLQPAAIQCNYLVYPGTSGTRFLDSIIGDRVVIPVESAKHYTERLLLLPASYQISYYTRHDSPVLQALLAAYYTPPNPHPNPKPKIQRNGNVNVNVDVDAGTEDNYTKLKELKQNLRDTNGIPRIQMQQQQQQQQQQQVVFCNFNKIDKIDLTTLHVWVNILRRVPNSILWLLEPSSQEPAIEQQEPEQQTMSVRRSIHNACLYVGISPHRIFYAPRVGKTQHLARQLAADLFLDTLVYGAHSTATDALRGGLPVLGTVGGTFPSRVVMSLYSSICKDDGSTTTASIATTSVYQHQHICSHFVRTTVKDFEDFAVDLVTSATGLSLLKTMTTFLSKSIHEHRGIFSTEQSTRNFLVGMEVLKEARVLENRLRKDKDNDNDKYHVFTAEN